MWYSILWEIMSTALAMVIAWYVVELVVHLRYKPEKGSRYRMTICEIDDDGSEDLFEVSKARYVRFETAFMLLSLGGPDWEMDSWGSHTGYDTLAVSKITTRHLIAIQKTGDLARALDGIRKRETIKR